MFLQKKNLTVQRAASGLIAGGGTSGLRREARLAKARAVRAKIRTDGKCHRKHTAFGQG